MLRIDSTDCPSFEPQPWSSAWYSHKFHGPAVRYEIAVTVRSAQIVWISGPWPAGSHSDIKIFRSNLKLRLGSQEFVIADSGYGDTRCLQPPLHAHPMQATYSRIRARHEVVNKRLKQFSVLTRPFRHKLSFHGVCFRAVANITVLILKEEPMFTIY